MRLCVQGFIRTFNGEYYGYIFVATSYGPRRYGKRYPNKKRWTKRSVNHLKKFGCNHFEYSYV